MITSAIWDTGDNDIPEKSIQTWITPPVLWLETGLAWKCHILNDGPQLVTSHGGRLPRCLDDMFLIPKLEPGSLHQILFCPLQHSEFWSRRIPGAQADHKLPVASALNVKYERRAEEATLLPPALEIFPAAPWGSLLIRHVLHIFVSHWHSAPTPICCKVLLPSRRFTPVGLFAMPR